MKDERLIVLLDAYLEGALSPEEKQELERMLLESDAARMEFWQRASLHGWTYAAAKLNYGAKPAAERARDRRGLRAPSVETFVRWLQRASRFGWKAALTGAAAAAAVLLWLGIRALPSLPRESVVADAAPEPVSEPEPVVNTNLIAVLAHGTGVVWDGETNRVEIGSTLASRWLRLKSGAVQIDFKSGARVILEGPAALELISAGETRLSFGKLRARVPVPAHGFMVHTRDATVTDLGTEFGMIYPLAQPVKVEVFEGKVKVATDGAARPRILNAGEGVQVSARQVRPMPAVETADFLTAAELARREATELRARYQDWRQADRALDADPAILVHLNFEDQRNADRNLINRANGAPAMIFGCDWGEGRWPGKGALEFNRLDDRVRLSVPGTFGSLTYLAWLRVDSLPNQWNALALADTFRTGETHWQIRRNGSVELSVRVEGETSAWDHLVSPPVITRELFGKWIQLAAVCDGSHGKMAIYLNGRLVASKTIKAPALTLGTLELGNWSPVSQRTEANYRVRDFHGRMDEFALLSRPLSADEIRRQFELGRPRATTAVAELTTSPSAKP